MTDEDIIALAEKHYLTLGMYPPAQLTPVSETTLKFIRPPGYTPYGAKLLAFAHELVELAQKEPAAGRPPAPFAKEDNP
jgi:hypothetical protein